MGPSRNPDTSIVQLALARKLITRKQYERCKLLLQKSRKIGLNTSIEDILVKQGHLIPEQISELEEIGRLAAQGDVFGCYRLQETLGEGGMGKVYVGVHEIMGRSVAIKVLDQQNTRDQSSLLRFFQEIKALAKLEHPNIVRIYDAGNVGRRYYYAMELLPGPSLKEYVDQKKGLSEKEALSIIRMAAEALAHAHAGDVVHRDVKPENIILDCEGRAKVSDFGLAMHRDVDHMTLTQEGTMVGSFFYISPEQINGDRSIDGRSDIYSLGATMYFALTGRPPFVGNTPEEVVRRHLSGNVVSPRQYNPKISRYTARVVRKAMACNRAKRYQSMDAFIAAIDRRTALMKFWRICGLALVGLALFALGMMIEAFLNPLGRFLWGP
jgi:serine/threonine protein kinase